MANKKLTVKDKGGRPSKYTPEFLQMAEDYLDNYAIKYEHAIPSVAGLSEITNIARSTIYEWSSDESKTEFSDILEKILSKQERLLTTNGLMGSFNAAITKLVLGKHGYHDKQDLTGKDGTPLIPDVIKTVYE